MNKKEISIEEFNNLTNKAAAFDQIVYRKDRLEYEGKYNDYDNPGSKYRQWLQDIVDEEIHKFNSSGGIQYSPNLPDAVKLLCEHLKMDKDLYYGYQSNIAMPFIDVFEENIGVDFPMLPTRKLNREHLHQVANDAAKRFLDTFINTVK